MVVTSSWAIDAGKQNDWSGDMTQKDGSLIPRLGWNHNEGLKVCLQQLKIGAMGVWALVNPLLERALLPLFKLAFLLFLLAGGFRLRRPYSIKNCASTVYLTFLEQQRSETGQALPLAELKEGRKLVIERMVSS